MTKPVPNMRKENLREMKDLERQIAAVIRQEAKSAHEYRCKLRTIRKTAERQEKALKREAAALGRATGKQHIRLANRWSILNGRLS